MGETENKLFEAIMKKDYDSARALIKQGASVNSRDSKGRSAVYFAVYSGSRPLASLMIKHASYAEKKRFGKLATAIALGNRRKIINIISNNKKELLKQDALGNSELTFAAIYNDAFAAGLLLKKGANPDVKNRSGSTPLMAACERGSIETVKILLMNNPKADVNASDKHGETPLSLAAANGHSRITALLINAGAKVNTVNRHGNTPLLSCAINGRLKSIKQLIKGGADINSRGMWHKTALHISVMKNFGAITQALIEAGADLNAKDQLGATPLGLAAAQGDNTTVLRLLKAGAEPDVKMDRGRTALMVASEAGNLKAAALLLEAGASLSVKDYDGKTPLCCAGSEKIKTMLEEMELAEINGQA